MSAATPTYPHSGSIRLSVETALTAGTSGAAGTRYARLVCRDGGVGMSAEVLERAFDPFFTTKPPGSGSGLGVAICDGITGGGEPVPCGNSPSLGALDGGGASTEWSGEIIGRGIGALCVPISLLAFVAATLRYRARRESCV